MPVKVFEFVPDTASVAYQPRDVLRLSGWEGGFDVSRPETHSPSQPRVDRIAYAELAGLAMFSCREKGAENISDVGTDTRPTNPYANPNARSRASGEQLSLPALLSSLLYPFRGSALVALLLLTIMPPVAAAVAIVFNYFGTFALALAAALVTSAVVFEIIRQTANGADALEGSPDFGEIGARFFELLATWVLGFIPAALSGLATHFLLSFEMESYGLIAVRLVILVVDLVCLCLCLMALGATAVYEDWSFAVRIDLHLRALVKCWRANLMFMLRVFVLVVLSGLVLMVPDSILLAALMIGPFLMLASAHFIGLLFRHNKPALEIVYLYK